MENENDSELLDLTNDPMLVQIKKLIKGTEMRKYGREGMPHKRAIFVTLAEDAVISHFSRKGI